MKHSWPRAVAALALAAGIMGPAGPSRADERTKTETFDRDPGWDGHNNRPKDPPVKIRQDFGFSPTSHAGGRAGEMGGLITPAAEPAAYGRRIEPKTFEDVLTASGTLACMDGGTHLLLGFFNADTLNEWRTPNTLAIRIGGRGDFFYAYVEYCTRTWRAGGDSPQSFPTAADPKTGKKGLVGFPSGGKPHRWSIRYDPNGNGGQGAITATVDDQTAICHLDEGHKADGAVFNRFGVLNVMKSADGGAEVYLDDVAVNGRTENFDKDPGWEGKDNRRAYETQNVRPRFDFGYSPTRFAGGAAVGELGGLTFRGDCRYPGRMGCYGDRVGPLTLERPLRASGKVAMRRGVSDSTTILGFFHSQDSMRSNPSQSDAIPECVAGIAIEGPSSEGFYFYPVYRAKGGDGRSTRVRDCPRIRPDGAAHDWAWAYDPGGAGGKGRVAVTLDGRSVELDLDAGQKAPGTQFDRFGIVTTWIDGNGQNVYFDDVTYTASQK